VLKYFFRYFLSKVAFGCS